MMDDLNQLPSQPQTPPTSSSTPSPTFNPPEQNLPSNWLKWIIVIIFVTLLSSAGTYFVLQSQKSPPSPAEVSTKVSPTPTPDPTTNWKTYTNKQIGYSIRYPEDQFLECSIQGDTTGFNLFKKRDNNDICAAGEGPAFLRFQVNPDLSRWENNPSSGCYNVIKDPKKILGFDGIRYTNQIKKETGNCIQASNMARNEIMDVFEYNGKTYSFYFYKNSDLSLIHQILSTFKFTQ